VVTDIKLEIICLHARLEDADLHGDAHSVDCSVFVPQRRFWGKSSSGADYIHTVALWHRSVCLHVRRLGPEFGHLMKSV